MTTDEARRFGEMVRAERQRADTLARVNLCVICAKPAAADMMTTCDECARTLCGYCAHSLSGEDVVCRDCYVAATGGQP